MAIAAFGKLGRIIQESVNVGSGDLSRIVKTTRDQNLSVVAIDARHSATQLSLHLPFFDCVGSDMPGIDLRGEVCRVSVQKLANRLNPDRLETRCSLLPDRWCVVERISRC